MNLVRRYCPFIIYKSNVYKYFITQVFFCTPSSSPLTFRPAQQADYLSSYLRRHVLGVLEQREIKEELVLGTAADTSLGRSDKSEWVLTDARNPLGAWQNQGALEHWKGRFLDVIIY